MQVPRYTYLPLLIPEIKENLVEVVLDDQAWAETDEKEWWFEEDSEGSGSPSASGGEGEGSFASQGPCKWYVLQSLRLSSDHPNSSGGRGTLTVEGTGPWTSFTYTTSSPVPYPRPPRPRRPLHPPLHP